VTLSGSRATSARASSSQAAPRGAAHDAVRTGGGVDVHDRASLLLLASVLLASVLIVSVLVVSVLVT
ncbi:hypothetical protein, partial [Promicromonospora kroppenstedtii]|uniref:hypothetical protein n=1 Tax=Promicromonospora kroppenstedtii TaxID=440482 RepID=UPI0005668ED5